MGATVWHSRVRGKDRGISDGEPLAARRARVMRGTPSPKPWLSLAVLALCASAASVLILAPAGERVTTKERQVIRPTRMDAWTIIGPGGGGTFYYPAISPHDPNLV